jgi:hypothetical protein
MITLLFPMPGNIWNHSDPPGKKKRVIPPPKHQAMETYMGFEVSLDTFLTLATQGSEWSAYTPVTLCFGNWSTGSKGHMFSYVMLLFMSPGRKHVKVT